MGSSSRLKALVIKCCDHRIQEGVHELIHLTLGFTWGEYLDVGVKGGAGNFDQVDAHLELARAHGAETVILITHDDCQGGGLKEHLDHARSRAESYGFPNILTYHASIIDSSLELVA